MKYHGSSLEVIHNADLPKAKNGGIVAFQIGDLLSQHEAPDCQTKYDIV